MQVLHQFLICPSGSFYSVEHIHFMVKESDGDRERLARAPGVAHARFKNDQQDKWPLCKTDGGFVGSGPSAYRTNGLGDGYSLAVGPTALWETTGRRGKTKDRVGPTDGALRPAPLA